SSCQTACYSFKTCRFAKATRRLPQDPKTTRRGKHGDCSPTHDVRNSQ
ncbi:hypothetical protein scyTo_0023266, partial [Scyliorhinus torazame]|nr:hypothetical protein [Scyliorhinus torazame]